MPRVTATICVVLLIGVLSLAAIAVVNTEGPVLAHGSNVLHAGGKITQLMQDGTTIYLTLKTSDGQTMQFSCTGRCLTNSVAHMERHEIEKAFTDVYYVHDPITGSLVATDVD
ncbi:MAG TPA: hypothetical protein VFB12_22415 [Ktedonobacteraceae bacterium]|nr:hypothetical protein [Ktedonobacteraceae bacterium]